MLRLVHASRFVKKMTNGKTSPCLIECEDDQGVAFELVVKYSNTLYEKEQNLAFEAIAALLAADLKLPVPEPFLVEFSEDFISQLPNEVKGNFVASCKIGFGSTLITGYSAWQKNKIIPESMANEAASIIVFDQIIQNCDRKPERPNCQFSGENFLIYDHEMAFTKTLFWVAPWEKDGMKDLANSDLHIFAGPYFEVKPNELDKFVEYWKLISDERLQEYKKALPPLWLGTGERIDNILIELSTARENIDFIVSQAIEVLSS